KLYGADMAGTAPALAFCDFTREVCGMRDADYIPQLLKICKTDHIDLLIPTIDTDLLVLSQNEAKFDEIGTKVLISKPDKIAICRDKNYTANFFESCGLKAPRTVNDYRLYCGPYPCFIKPKDGSSSINAFKVENESELKIYAEQVGDYIVQPFIEGTEYTVDIFCNYEGNPVFITPRIRVAVRAGEVLKTEIAMDEKIIEECRNLIAGFQPCGPMTVQLIRQNRTGDDYYIEINPRFGGGAPLSMKAGARSAEAILRILSGETEGYSDRIDDGAVYSRFDQSVCITEGKRNQAIMGVIFDLDDTLYSEKQYVRSGYKAVAKLLGDEALADRLWAFFENGKPAIDELLNELGCMERKGECLEVYREQMPEITLYDGVSDLIFSLKNKGIKVGIITDGRVTGQKNKIQALGLNELVDDIIITDELGGTQFRKPCDIAFRIMQCKWGLPFEQMVYVGDNAVKDLQAPKQLGMRWIHYMNEDGIYLKSGGKSANVVGCVKELAEKMEDFVE
ncbi:MAG TPA: HAD-IA family hydrolase, partial [Paludibacter sp.]|nr:HAD-IA family hydrolase [Paludibacter sp.]